jgi:hypothetical protein
MHTDPWRYFSLSLLLARAHSHTHTRTRTHICRLHLNPHACACTHIQRSRHSMTAFGTCAGTVRHSACVQFKAHARVCDGHVCVCVGHRSSAHLCRRCHLDLAHHQRAMGCPSLPHVRDRRRRRHLRHRRHWRRHQIQGRLGEHQRRCGPDSQGRSYSRGTRGYF